MKIKKKHTLLQVITMNKKEEFKAFVKKNPRLIKFVKEGSMNWQKFYEIFDLYGEDENAWKDYLKKEEKKSVENTSIDLVSWLKNIYLDGVQNGMNSLQRVVALLGELTTKSPTTTENAYKPRPLYKHFED